MSLCAVQRRLGSIILSIFIILSCIIITYGKPQKRPVQDNYSKAWDIFIFTQNWPSAVCSKWKQDRGGSCNNFPANTWTIHGVWPTKLGTTGPGFCDNSKPFRPQEFFGIQNQLEKFWVSVHGSNEHFWNHEWTKHGTCATQILPTQLSYFSKALNWIQQYNAYDILKSSGILPGGSYSVDGIVNAVRRAVNKNPQVLCYAGKSSSVLLEVRICFDKKLQPTDCNGASFGGSKGNMLTNCRTNQLVLYPY